MNISRLGRVALAACGLLLGASPAAHAQAPIYKSIPLDCGGWFSGFDISSDGRLYGYGDVFGVWRSDAGQAGASWRYLQGDFTVSDNVVVGLSTAATDPDIVVFATSKNVYRSTDGGTNWSPILTNISGPGLLDRGSSAVKIHPTNSNEIWLARARDGMSGLLWRSTNGGSSWDKIGGSTFDTIRPLSVYIHHSYPNQIWVGAWGGFYVSTDSGSTFSLVWNNNGQNNPSFPNDPAIVKSLVRRADGTGYFAANIGGFRVTATNWADASTYVCTQTVNRVGGQGPVTAAVLANGDFITSASDPEQNIKRSTTSGSSWVDLTSILVTPPTPAWTIPATPSSQRLGGRDMIVIDPTNQSRWFMTGGKSPVITTDSGATWKYPPPLNGLAGVPTYRVQFPRNNSNLVLIAGADHGAFTLDDGGASREADSSSRASFDYNHAVHDVLSSDNGQTLIAAGVNQGTNENLILRSTDAGMTWSPVAFSGLTTNSQGINRAVAAPGNVNDFLVLLGSEPGHPRNNPGLYRTTNGGANFAKVGGSLFDGVDTGSRYHHEYSWLAADGVNTNTRYLTLRSAENATARGFYRSTDGGSNWSKLPNQPFGNDWIHAMCVDPLTAGRVWVAGDYQGIKRSNNGGDSWTSVGGFTKAFRVSAHAGRLAVWGRRGSDTWNKVYYSLDDGLTWSEKTGPGHRYAFLTDLAVDPYRIGQIWISGLSVNVIDTGTNPASTLLAPTNLNASASTSNIALTWSDTNSEETGYKVERKTSTTDYVELYRGTTPNETSFTDNNVTVGVTYTYQMRAYTANVANGPYSASAGATVAATQPPPPGSLAAPTNLNASASTSNIALTWSDTNSEETGYKVERKTATTSYVELYRGTTANETSYTDTSVTTGVAYTYQVRAYTANVANGPYSASVSAMPGVNTVNRATGGIATTSSTNSPSNEGVVQAFDGSASTKWLTFATSGWIGYTFGGGASYTLTSYALTSANDVPARDPRDWQLQGSNDGTSWTPVATETGQTFASRYQRRVFTVSSPGNYNRYRLNISSNNGETYRTQLAELELY